MIHLQEKRFIDNSGHTALYPNVRICIHTDIGFIFHHAVKAAFIPQIAPLGADAAGIQIICDMCKRNALLNLLEYLTHNRGLGIYNGIPLLTLHSCAL